MIRSGLPIQEAVAEVVSIEAVTHDMRHLVLKLVEPTEITFFPGQYVDITIPGTDETRSFSMANTSSRDSGQLEFVIRVYPDGLFSGFLDTELGGRRPARRGRAVRGLHAARRRDGDLVFVGGGAGHGADPVAAAVDGRARHHPQGHVLLRRAAPAGPVLREGAATPSRRRCRASATCRRCPSRPTATAGTARSGFITDVVRSARERPRRRRRLRLRPAADGGGGDGAAHRARRTREAHLLRQVHHHR